MQEKSTQFRWVIVTLLFIITLINYIDRASISYAIGDISKEFNLSDDKVGLILGAFGIGYLVTTFLGGIAADKYGAKLTLLISIIFWGIAALATGLATGFIMLFSARILLGLAEGPNFPAMTRGISDWLSMKERNRALSYALISVPLALAISGPVLSQLILALSWRGAYYVLAIFAFIWIPLWLWFFHDKPEDSAYVNAEELAQIHADNPKTALKSKKINWSLLLTNRTLLANNWAFFVFGYYLFFFMTWLPTYLSKQYHLNVKQIGLYSVAPWLLAALMMWGVGVWADYLYKKTGSLRISRSYLILGSQLLAALCIIPIILTHDVFMAMLFISLAVGFVMSANASYYAVNIDIAKEWAGTSLGIMDALFAIAGFIAPTLTGFIISINGHFEAAFYLLIALALSSSLVTLIAHNR